MNDLKESLNANRTFFVDFVRIYVGFVLIQKGIYFYNDPDNLLTLMHMNNAPFASYVFAHYIIFAHLLGGVFLIVGFLTRIMVIFQIPILAGASIFIHSKEGFFGEGSNFAYANIILMLLVFFLLYGSGRLSVDYYIENRTYK